MSGLSARDLSATVRAPSLYALESIPSAFNLEEVQAVLNTTRSDRTVKGLRDFAILMLLSTYGLRSCEIMRLQFEDIDWRCERLLIRPSKNGLETVLPLMPAVGEALIDYLRKGRPKVPARQIFVCMSAPYLPFKTATAVYYIVTNRTKQAGIQPRKYGARVFRHTRAVSLLRSAVPLKSIADILGHVTTRSTTTYLKLATEDLRAVGLEIPSETEVQV
jgi:site-specific recombinase XerD